MQIITLLKRSHSSWRSNRLLETAARREGSWGGAVGRKWEINSVSVSATVRHIFLLSFHLIKPVEWALVGSYTRPSKMEIYHCWPFDHQSPCEQIWRNWLDRLINRQGGEIFACFFFCTSAFVSLVSWLGGVVVVELFKTLWNTQTWMLAGRDGLIGHRAVVGWWKAWQDIVGYFSVVGFCILCIHC